MTCAPKFVIVWCHVVENVLKLKASNLNICHRLFALIITVFSNVIHVFSEIFINIKVLFLLLQINIVIQYLTVLLIYYRVSV